MKVGLEEYRHEAGECYERQVATLEGPCGDPRCEKAAGEQTYRVQLASGWEFTGHMTGRRTLAGWPIFEISQVHSAELRSFAGHTISVEPGATTVAS